jgi:hypothetical protein
LRDRATISKAKFGEEGPEALAAIRRTCERPGPITIASVIVATLGEAQMAVKHAEAMADFPQLRCGRNRRLVDERAWDRHFPGGRAEIRRLRDGTTIEVEPISWEKLGNQINGFHVAADDDAATQARLVAAYNTQWARA